MNTWAQKLREALSSLPDANAVYYYVVPEAKRAAEADKARKVIKIHMNVQLHAESTCKYIFCLLLCGA